MLAHYVGTPQVEFLSNGRHVKLIRRFAFSDPNNLLWAVPAGAVVDGASIPKIFWSLTGGPFEGKYRDPSIIHDWFCDTRQRAWEATHRVFYDAMIVSKVPKKHARVLYFAVRWGGPRWETRVSINTNLLAQTQLHDRLDDLRERNYDGHDTQMFFDGLVREANSQTQRRVTYKSKTKDVIVTRTWLKTGDFKEKITKFIENHPMLQNTPRVSIPSTVF